MMLKSSGIDSEEELGSLIKSKTAEAYKRGYLRPWEYVMEAVVSKYPQSRDLMNKFWPPDRKAPEVYLADPKSTVICRIFGKQNSRVVNACDYYVNYYKLEKQVGMISNLIVYL
jgi:hypothetical protein